MIQQDAGTRRPEGRDYRLTGPEGVKALQSGLASPRWYRSPIAREELKQLMARRDGPAIRDTLIWFSLLGLSGFASVAFWGSWLSVPAFAVYGVLYGSASDSRWHECGHGTAFRTRWMNTVVYQIACFMILREPDVWRSSHARHHAETIIVGRDPEIGVKRPPNLPKIALDLLGLVSGFHALKGILLHAAGRLSAEEATFIPMGKRARVYRVARCYLLILTLVGLLSVWMGSMLPLMLVGLPTFYGAWLQVIFGITQHAGLAEDVHDYRLNSRTVTMNPVFRFIYWNMNYIYWNMNYHVEHHMFPAVPYHALPALHAAIKDDLPPPSRGLLEAYREIIPALLRQVRDPTFHIEPRCPRPQAANSPGGM
jgi:fatty acid desaturase